MQRWIATDVEGTPGARYRFSLPKAVEKPFPACPNLVAEHARAVIVLAVGIKKRFIGDF
jgi:hypothetical protein